MKKSVECEITIGANEVVSMKDKITNKKIKIIFHVCLFTLLISIMISKQLSNDMKLLLMVMTIFETYHLVIRYGRIGKLLTVGYYLIGAVSIFSFEGFRSHYHNSLMAYQVSIIISIFYLSSYIIKNKEINDYLYQHSIIDSLSEVYNKRYYDERIVEELNRANREGSKVGLTVIDIDKFKEINDTYGHSYGDVVIKDLSTEISKTMGKDGAFCRYGGDEFILITPNHCDHCSQQIKELLFEAVESFNVSHSFISKHPVSISIGTSIYPDDATEVDELFRKADASMYISKKMKGNTFTLCNSWIVNANRG